MYDGYYKYDAEQARTYDSTRETEEHWCAEADFIGSWMTRAEASTLLDVPVGTGRFLPLYRNVKKVVGIDISEQMLEVARTRIVTQELANVTLQHGDVRSLPFQQGSFDVSVCCRLLHLLPEELLVPVMKEIARVTRGSVIVQVYIKGPVFRRTFARAGRLWSRWRRRASAARVQQPWLSIQAFFYSRERLVDTFAAAGLTIKQETTISRYQGHSVVMFVLDVA